MGKIHNLTESEKVLLNILGKHPDITMKDLLQQTPYKWVSTVVKKVEQLKKKRIIGGPIYDIDYQKLCKNPLHKLYCILETEKSPETVISYLLLIESLHWIVYILSPHKKLLNVGFFSSDDEDIRSLLQLLKDCNIIIDYITRPYFHRRMVENPNFFGDSNPPLDNLLDPCEIPDMSMGSHDMGWSECDIAILPYLGRGYKGLKLIEILKKEKKLDRTWTYEQIKYSHEKMVENGLIRKLYVILPYPSNQCIASRLFLKCEDTEVTQRVLCNFGKETRIYKEYMLCEDWGSITCISHPLFLTSIMNKLDLVEEIKEKELFLSYSHSQQVQPRGQSPRLQYYDIDRQVLEYPYHLYRERIEEKLENEELL
ncbi:MAG: hypothetical protein HXS44_14420 [Theionarchaea archaeon]|nr:hypothetical protein [Theionarchaea archaeon]